MSLHWLLVSIVSDDNVSCFSDHYSPICNAFFKREKQQHFNFRLWCSSVQFPLHLFFWGSLRVFNLWANVFFKIWGISNATCLIHFFLPHYYPLSLHKTLTTCMQNYVLWPPGSLSSSSFSFQLFIFCISNQLISFNSSIFSSVISIWLCFL